MKRNLTNTIKTIIVSAFTFVAVSTAMPTYAAGVDVFQGCNNGSSSTTSGTSSGGTSSSTSGSSICGAAQQDDFGKLMNNIVNTILVVLGMIAVIMVVIGGIRYTTSNGDASQITAAKNTILYAVIGLIIAILAYAIVNYVLASFK